jgi:hypothetical protein
MIQWLKKLFGACDHKWVIIKEIEMYSEYSAARGVDVPIGTKYVLQCEHCGDLKSFRNY